MCSKQWNSQSEAGWALSHNNINSSSSSSSNMVKKRNPLARYGSKCFNVLY